MKKVLIIFLLITAASCGGKSTEEQAMADSIAAAAAAADSIAAAAAADGEILIISYELFKNDGYNGSFQQFKILLAQNPDALNYMYTLYSNRKGYTGDLKSYLKLIEIVPEASSDELKSLYDVIVEAKKYTKSFEEFKAQWNEQAGYKEKVFDVVYQDNLYWSGRDVFFEKYLKDKTPTSQSDKSTNEQKSTQTSPLSSDEVNLMLGLILGCIGIGMIIIFRKKLTTIFIMRKIQDYILLLITNISLILGVFLLTVSNTLIDEDFFFGVIFTVTGGLFLVPFFRRKFIDFTLFFLSLGGFSLAFVLLFDNNEEKSPLLFVPSIFILFILWKDNFFTKEPRTTPLDGTREKGKEMLDELRKMGPDESMVGKTVIKKASVKKEEDKNSKEE